MRIFKKIGNKEEKGIINSKDAAKERLHLVLMQDRANVSADFLELMKQEIIEVIKKYIDVDESAIDVRLTNKENEDGTNGAPALYANIPIVNIKNEAKKTESKEEKVQEEQKKQDRKDDFVKSEKEDLLQEEKRDNQIQEVSQKLEQDSFDKKETLEDKTKNEQNGQDGEQQKRNEELKPEN